MFGLSNFIITEFLLIFYSLVTNVLYSYKGRFSKKSIFQKMQIITRFISIFVYFSVVEKLFSLDFIQKKTYPYDIIRIGLSILIFTYYFQNYTSTHT